MKKKMISIIMCAAILIGAAMPAAACSKREIDDMIAAAQQLEQVHKPSCDFSWFLQRYWSKADDHEEDEPAEDPETEEQTAEPEESEPEQDNPASHLIVPSIESLESAINTMNNLYKPTWGDPDAD